MRRITSIAADAISGLAIARTKPFGAMPVWTNFAIRKASVDKIEASSTAIAAADAPNRSTSTRSARSPAAWVIPRLLSPPQVDGRSRSVWRIWSGDKAELHRISPVSALAALPRGNAQLVPTVQKLCNGEAPSLGPQRKEGVDADARTHRET